MAKTTKDDEAQAPPVQDERTPEQKKKATERKQWPNGRMR